MSRWPSSKAKRVLAALIKAGWEVKRQSGSHRTLGRPGWPDYVFSFRDSPMLTGEGSLPWKAGSLRRGAVDRANSLLHR